MARQRVIRLTESELNMIIENSVNKILTEAWYNNRGDFKRGIGKVGKGIRNAAAIGTAGAALTLGGLQGLENDSKKWDSYNQEVIDNGANQLQDERQWIIDNELDLNDPQSWEMAREALGH